MSTNEIIETRVIKAKNDERELEELLKEYKPFIKSTIRKVVKIFVDEQNELFSVGYQAFYESVCKYQEKQGAFIPFVTIVIRNRVIDYLRKGNRIKNNELLIQSYENSNGENVLTLDFQQSMDNYHIETENEYRKQEILMLKGELQKYSLSFEDLVENCPKRKKVRDLYKNMAIYVVNDGNLLCKTQRLKRLPIQPLEEYFKISRKKIERGRKYILAIIIILSGEYNLIRQYIEER